MSSTKRHQQLKLEIQKLEADLEKHSQNFEKVGKLSKELSDLKEIEQKLHEKEKIEKYISENKEVIQESEDKEMIEIAQVDIEKLSKKLKTINEALENFFNPSDRNDLKDAILEIRAGTGGEEASLFAQELFEMYTKFAKENNFSCAIMNSNRTGLGGIKEIIIEITGKNAYKTFKYESGVHRVQRVPETEKSGRLHTSAATVAVFPVAEEVDVEIRQEDLRIDVYRSSGHGGQSVNTTDSAVRITHIPTGTVVTCQDEKSQHKNKAKAMKVLRSRIFEKVESEKHEKEREQRKSMVKSGDRSDKIRTYNYPQNRITDHRIGENFNLESIIEGNLGKIIERLREEEKKNG